MALFGAPTSLKQYQQQQSGKASGGTYSPDNANNPNSPAFQQRFAQAAASGYFDNQDPYGLNGLMGSPEYQGAGNNTQKYDAAYQSAVSASRSNITQALGAALTELNNRQASINAAGAAAPGQIDASYGRANDAINANTGAVSGIMGQAGVDPSIGPSQAGANAPVLAALAGNQAEAQAGVQPMVSGLGAEISKERASTQMDAADKLASLDMQAADHASSAASAANEPSWMQKMMIQNKIDSANAKQAADVKKATSADKVHGDLQSLQAKAGNHIAPSAGKTYANSKVAAQYVNQVESGGAGRASTAYAHAMQQLGAANDKSDAKAFKNALAKLNHHFPKQHIPISIAMYRLGLSDKDLAQIRAAK